MDYLKDGIGLRAMAQRDPLVEYQREGYALFQSMMSAIREDAVGFLFNLEVEVTASTGQAQVTAKGLNQPQTPQNLSYTAPSADGDVEVRNQRGQVLQAPTDAARRAQPQVSAAFGGPSASPAAGAPAAPTTRRAAQAQAQGEQSGGQSTGAFGQKQPAPKAGPAPVNRAQRRAQEKKKGR
jgi:preprotein translocase subunit SecA